MYRSLLIGEGLQHVIVHAQPLLQGEGRGWRRGDQATAARPPRQGRGPSSSSMPGIDAVRPRRRRLMSNFQSASLPRSIRSLILAMSISTERMIFMTETIHFGAVRAVGAGLLHPTSQVEGSRLVLARGPRDVARDEAENERDDDREAPGRR